MTSLVFGLLFAYFGRNWAFHGLFLFGQSLVFFAGVDAGRGAVALAEGVPGQGPGVRARPGRRRPGAGRLLHRWLWPRSASALFGAVPGSFFGNGFESFLAEDVVREPDKTALQLAVIGHLHIMLTLIAVALALIVGRWLDFKGPLHKVAMPLMIAGHDRRHAGRLAGGAL